MARPVPAEEVTAIIDIVRHHLDGVGLQDFVAALPDDVPVRTLQYRLQRLAEEGQLVKQGERRWTRYRLPRAAERELPVLVAPIAEGGGEPVTPVSAAGGEIRADLRQLVTARRPSGTKAHIAPPDHERFRETAEGSCSSCMKAVSRATKYGSRSSRSGALPERIGTLRNGGETRSLAMPCDIASIRVQRAGGGLP